MNMNSTTEVFFLETNESVSDMTSSAQLTEKTTRLSIPYCRLSNEHLCDVALEIKNVILSISVIAVAASLVCILLTRYFRTFHERIISQLLLANFLAALAVISGDGEPPNEYSSGCIAQGFFHLLFDWVEILWMVFLTIFLFTIVIHNKEIRRFERYFTIAAWIPPLVLACLPLSTSDFGPSGAPYCWLKNTPTGKGWRFGIYLGPVVACLIGMLVAIAYMLWHVRKAQQHYRIPADAFALDHQRRVEKYLKPLIGYVISFLLIKLFILITRIQDALDKPISGWLIFLVIVHSIYGLILSTLYFVTSWKTVLTAERFTSGLNFYRNLICHRKLPSKPEVYEVNQGV